MSEGNSITVSAKAKRQVGDYEPVEVMIAYTLVLAPDATIEEFNATETVLYGEIVGQLEAQLTDAVRRLQESKLDGAAVTQEADRRPRQPDAFPKPVTAPATGTQNAPQTAQEPRRDVLDEGMSIQWHKAPYWPKKADRKIGQWWCAKVLEFEKGEFTSTKDSSKKYNALVLTCEDGKFPKTLKVFHDAPAYPSEGTPYREFFKDGKYQVADRGVYVVLAHTGKEYNGALEAVPIAFTTTPEEAAALLPTFD